MDYVEGFVAAVPTKNKEEYIRHATQAAQLFKEHGAIRLVECWGDDIPTGEKTPFKLAVQCRDDETVVFSWITWPSRQDRDSGMIAIANDIRMQENPMPFDGSRLIYGGFQMIVSE